MGLAKAPYHPGHLEAVVAARVQAAMDDEFTFMPDLEIKRGFAMYANSVCADFNHTILHHEPGKGTTVVLVGGARVIRPGVFETWMLFDPYPEKFKGGITKLLLEIGIEAAVNNRIHRVQSHVPTWEGGYVKSWMEMTGFELEGTLKKAGPEREDVWLFSMMIGG